MCRFAGPPQVPRLAFVVQVHPLRLWDVDDVGCVDERLDGAVAVHMDAEVVKGLAVLPQLQEDSDS